MKKLFIKTASNEFRLLFESIKDPTIEEMREYLVSIYGDYKENEFDIEAAIYWFSSLYHSGQWSNLYRALSTSEYRPGSLEKHPIPGGDIEYTYLLHSIKFETNELMKPFDLKKITDYVPKVSNGGSFGGFDRNDNSDDDNGDEYIFKIKKSELVDDTSDEIDKSYLEQKMKEFLNKITKRNVSTFSYDLENTRQIEETMLDVMYGSLVDKYAK